MEQKISVKREARAIPAEGHLVLDLKDFEIQFGGDAVDITSVLSVEKFHEIAEAKDIPDIVVLVYEGGALCEKFKINYTEFDETLYGCAVNKGIKNEIVGAAVLVIEDNYGHIKARIIVTDYVVAPDIISLGSYALFDADTDVTSKINSGLIGDLLLKTRELIIEFNGNTSGLNLFRTGNYFVNEYSVYFPVLHFGDNGVDGVTYLKLWRQNNKTMARAYTVPFGV